MKYVFLSLLSIHFCFSQVCQIKTQISAVKLKKDLDSWLPFSKKSELYFDVYFEGDKNNRTYIDFVVFDEDINKNMKIDNFSVTKEINDNKPSEVERLYLSINEYDLRNNLDILEGLNPYTDSGSVLYQSYITIWKYAKWIKKSENEWYKKDTLKNNKIEVFLISQKRCL